MNTINADLVNNTEKLFCSPGASLSLLFLRLLLVFSSMTAVMTSVFAQEETKSYFEMTLEELLNVEITSVSRTEQKWVESAAAVYVVTR
jgi:hypothetical protein